MKQQNLFDRPNLPYFGGHLLKGRRRSARPLSSKKPIHMVLRTEIQERENGLFRFRGLIDQILNENSKKFGVRIYKRSINLNHLHLVMRIHSRNEYRKFIRAVSSLIAFQVRKRLACMSGAKGSKNDETQDLLKRRFWSVRPFTRVLEWGRDLNYTLNYVLKNTLESLGLVPYEKRKPQYVYKRYILGRGTS